MNERDLQERDLIEEVTLQDLEQRIEFSCCAGPAFGSGPLSGGGPNYLPCDGHDGLYCRIY